MTTIAVVVNVVTIGVVGVETDCLLEQLVFRLVVLAVDAAFWVYVGPNDEGVFLQMSVLGRWFGIVFRQ